MAFLAGTGGVKKQIVGAGVAAVAPWLVFVLLSGATTAEKAQSLLLVAFSVACLILIAMLLRPVEKTAEALRSRCGESGDTDQGELLDRDATRLVERLDALEHRWIQRHGLTGLPIRESLLSAIDADIGTATEAALLGAIRFADYKRLFAFDPAGAEAALKIFADRLAASLGKDRPFGHVDRDCFAIWFKGADADSARIELGALAYASTQEIAVGELKLIPDVEVGTALYPTDAMQPPALLNHALASLARRAGALEGSPAAAALLARERFALEQDLRVAIERQQFELNFQPVVDLSKGLLVGAEALLRWRHPIAGLIPPDRFIPVVEDADLAGEIGMWALNAACRAVQDWRQQGVCDVKIAVNLSARQLRDPNLKPGIERTLARYQLLPAALELELTETAATEDAERTLTLFSELRALGIGLAIDDFGSGYSSLSYLKNLPFDKLKIDREFVTNVHRRKDSLAICRTLVELARGLDLEILAEGVETLEEVEALQAIGCNLFQGFYFSRPLTSAQFVAYALDPAGRRRASPIHQRPSRMSA